MHVVPKQIFKPELPDGFSRNLYISKYCGVPVSGLFHACTASDLPEVSQMIFLPPLYVSDVIVPPMHVAGMFCMLLYVVPPVLFVVVFVGGGVVVPLIQIFFIPSGTPLLSGKYGSP